jgi:hypothetical protein
VSAAVELPGPDPDEGPATEEDREAWLVDGIGRATWAMEKVRGIALEQQRIEQLTAARVERLQSWAAGQIQALQHDRDFFEGKLKQYALDVRAANPRRTTVSTAFGVVETRSAAGGWQIDREVAIAWAKEHRPDLVKVEESFVLSQAKKVLEVADGEVVDPDTGVVVPGVIPGQRSTTARVKVDLGGE